MKAVNIVPPSTALRGFPTNSYDPTRVSTSLQENIYVFELTLAVAISSTPCEGLTFKLNSREGGVLREQTLAADGVSQRTGGKNSKTSGLQEKFTSGKL